MVGAGVVLGRVVVGGGVVQDGAAAVRVGHATHVAVVVQDLLLELLLVQKLLLARVIYYCRICFVMLLLVVKDTVATGIHLQLLLILLLMLGLLLLTTEWIATTTILRTNGVTLRLEWGGLDLISSSQLMTIVHCGCYLLLLKDLLQLELLWTNHHDSTTTTSLMI